MAKAFSGKAGLSCRQDKIGLVHLGISNVFTCAFVRGKQLHPKKQTKKTENATFLKQRAFELLKIFGKELRTLRKFLKTAQYGISFHHVYYDKIILVALYMLKSSNKGCKNRY